MHSTGDRLIYLYYILSKMGFLTPKACGSSNKSIQIFKFFVFEKKNLTSAFINLSQPTRLFDFSHNHYNTFTKANNLYIKKI